MPILERLAVAIGADTSGLQEGFSQIAQAAKGAEGPLAGIKGILGGMGPIMSALPIAAVGAAFVGMAKTGLDNIKQVHTAMQKFRVETGASEEEAQRFSQTIRELHKVNTDSYEALGAAVTALRQRHGDLGDQMGPLTQKFLDFAKVTGQDTAQAIDIVSDVLARFNLPLDQAGTLMDKMMAATQATGIPVQELEEALRASGTQLQAMGFSLEEAISMLGAFHKAGVDAGSAQRALNTFMKNTEELSEQEVLALQQLGVQLSVARQATEETAKAAAKYGIELQAGMLISEEMAARLDELGIEYKTMGSLAGTHADALRDMFQAMASGEPTVEQMQAAMQLFGSRVGPEMLQAISQGKVGLEELMATIQGAEGVVSEASATFDKQLGERWTLIRRKYLEPFMEAIGDRLLKVIEFVLAKIEEYGPQIEAVFRFLGDVIGPIMDTIVSAIRAAFNVISGLVKTFSGVLSGDWSKLAEGIKQVWNALWDLVGSVLQNAFKLIDSLFGGLPSKTIQKVKEVADGVVKWFTDLKDRAVKLVTDMVKAIQEWFGNTKLGKIVGAVSDTVGKVVGFFSDMYTKIVGKSFVPDTIAGIEMEFSRLGAVMVQPAQNATSQVESAFNTMFTKVGTWAANFKEELAKAFNKAYSSIDSFCKDAATALVGFFDAVASGEKTFQDFGDFLKDFLLRFLSALEIQVLAAQAAGIATAIAQAPATFGASLLQIPAILAQAAATLAIFEGLKAIIRGLAEGGIVRSPTLAMVGEAGPEAVVPLHKLGSLGGDQTIIIELDGRQIARRTLPYMPGELRLRGVTV